jgi:hypothetical protein
MRFHSVEQAIRYSFNIGERAEYSRSDPAKVRGTSGDELSPMDLHAQAAMIQSIINRLHPVERDSVLALYGRGKARTDAIRSLSEYMHPGIGEQIKGIRELQIILLHWATKRPSIRKIAEDCGVSYRRVCAWRSAVLRAWMPLHARAVERLHTIMFVEGDFELAE